MATGYCDTSKITAIADSIRTKIGKTDTITLDNMPSEIESIGGGGSPSIYIGCETDSSIGPKTSYTYPYYYDSSLPQCFENVTLIANTYYTSPSDNYKVYSGFFANASPSSDPSVTVTGPPILKFKNVTLKRNSDYESYVRGPFGAKAQYGTASENDNYLLSSIEFENCVFEGSKCCYQFFQYQSSLTSLDLSSVTLSEVTSMNSMFFDCSSLTTLDLSNFNTGSVTDMTYMFFGCSSLTSLDLSNFNTSSTTSMESMFFGCSSLTSLDLSNFNTSSVYYMSSMFSGCSSLTSLDVSNFNTSSVEYMSSMFSGCSSLTSLDLSNFNTSSVYYMSSMFFDCSSLTSLTLGENWGSKSSLTSFDLSYCPLTHDSCLDVFNKLATKTSTATLTLSSTTKSLMSDDEIAIATNKGWTVS